jgi:capsular exopolysaccharide synthesis family protein
MTQVAVEQLSDTPDIPSGITSRNLVQVFWQRKGLVVLGLVIGIILGSLYYVQLPAIYQSTAQVFVVKEVDSPVQVQGADPRQYYFDDYVSAHMTLIKTPIIVKRAVEKKNLKALQSFEGITDPTGVIIANLSAGRDSKGSEMTTAPNNIIILTYRGQIMEECGIVLEAVIASYQDFLDDAYHKKNRKFKEGIESARADLERQRTNNETRLKEFQEASPMMFKLKDGGNIHQARINSWEEKRSALVARISEIQARLRELDAAVKNGTTKDVVLTATPEEKAAMAALDKIMEEQLFPLLVQEKGMIEDWGPDHPQVRTLRVKITMVKDFFDRMKSMRRKGLLDETVQDKDPVVVQIELLRQELGEREAQLGSLEKLLHQEYKEAKEMRVLEIKDEKLRTENASLTRVLERIDERLRDMNLARGGGFSAQAISPPGIGVKVSPNSFVILFGGAMLGQLLGCGLAYLADATDVSFRTPDEIRRRLGLQILGHIPFRTGEGVSAGPITLPDGRQTELSPTLPVYHQPGSLEAEAFRAVRTALYFSTHGESQKVIQVTSPNKGDGKSTVAANLALSIAQSGKTVLLIDADFRRPRQHRLFGMSSPTGLASVLSEDCELIDAIQPTGFPGLSLLPCGPRPNNPAELLTSPRLEVVFEMLRDRYDYVIVDTPPLLAVTDPCVVAARVDGLLLTIRVSKDGRPAAVRAREMLMPLGVKILGAVVNGVGPSAHGKGYGYEHYHYGYEYGYHYNESSDDKADENGEEEVVSAKPADMSESKPAGLTSAPLHDDRL